MIKYSKSPYDIFTEGESLTEQEHLASCDINLMLKASDRGIQVRGGADPVYGYDDTTMDAVQFRIQKADLEEKLLNGQKEFTAEELKLFPPDIVEKFGYKLKQESKPDEEPVPKATKNDKTKKKPKVEAPVENTDDDSDTE